MLAFAAGRRCKRSGTRSLPLPPATPNRAKNSSPSTEAPQQLVPKENPPFTIRLKKAQRILDLSQVKAVSHHKQRPQEISRSPFREITGPAEPMGLSSWLLATFEDLFQSRFVPRCDLLSGEAKDLCVSEPRPRAGRR